MKKQSILYSIILAFVFTAYLPAQEAPKRILSLAPNITEIIYRLGQGDKLVGRTEYCLYPPAAEKVTTIGGYLNPDLESIVALQPDIVFLLPNVDMDRKLQMLGLKTFTVANETIDEILHGIEAIGRTLGCTERAMLACQGIRDTLDFIGSHHLRPEMPTSTLLVIGRQAGSLKGLYAAGTQTYLNEILELSGGENIFPDVESRYFDVSKEDLVLRNPESIIEFRMIDAAEVAKKTAELRGDWQSLSTLTAVQENRIHYFTDRYFLIPGPRIAKIAMAFHELLLPAAE